MKLINTLFCILLFICFAHAQREFDYSDKEEDDTKERSGYQVIIADWHLDPIKGLEDLTNNEYPSMNKQGFQYRIRYGFGKKKISPIVDLSYYYRSTVNSTILINTANIRSFGLGIGHNFNLIDKKHFFIKPMYLLNFTWYKINFTENLSGNNLNEILNSDYKEFTLKSFQVPLQVGLNLGVKFTMDDSEAGLMLGGGYMLNYNNSAWKFSQDNQISNNINLSSLYLSAGLITLF